MSDSTGVVGLADAVSDLLYGIAGWALVGYGLLLAVVGAVVPFSSSGVGAGSIALAAAIFAIGLTCVLGGLFVNPRFRRRLDRRHGVTHFGHLRSVDQRAIRPEERCLERCVVCDSRVERGMVRRFRDEYACFGVPVYTRGVDRNHYCLECALEELHGPEAGVPDEPDGEDPLDALESAEAELEAETEAEMADETAGAPTDASWRFPASTDPRLEGRGDREADSEREAKRESDRGVAREPERERE